MLMSLTAGGLQYLLELNGTAFSSSNCYSNGASVPIAQPTLEIEDICLFDLRFLIASLWRRLRCSMCESIVGGFLQEDNGP